MFDGQHTHAWSGKLPQEASLQVLESLNWKEERQVYGAAHKLVSVDSVDAASCVSTMLRWGFLVLKLPESPI